MSENSNQENHRQWYPELFNSPPRYMYQPIRNLPLQNLQAKSKSVPYSKTKTKPKQTQPLITKREDKIISTRMLKCSTEDSQSINQTNIVNNSRSMSSRPLAIPVFSPINLLIFIITHDVLIKNSAALTFIIELGLEFAGVTCAQCAERLSSIIIILLIFIC